MDRQIYSRAPITEAVIDLRVEPKDGIQPLHFEQMRESLKADYPNIKKQIENEFKVQLGETPAATSISQEVGLRFASPDGKYVLQVKAGGFTLSRLQPYERWEPFRDEAKRLWQTYVSLFAPKRITRTAVRFINRVDCPGPSVELEHYFNVFPKVPAKFDINHLVMQLAVPQKDINSTLLINQALIPPASPGVISILLDFDLFCDIPRDINDNDGLWVFFDILRNRKDQAFEDSITDKVRELIL